MAERARGKQDAPKDSPGEPRDDWPDDPRDHSPDDAPNDSPGEPRDHPPDDAPNQSRMIMQTFRGIFLCTAATLLAALAGASQFADSSIGASLPGLTSDEGSNLAAESCWVTLSGENASVELSLRVDSNQAALLLEGPLFGRQGEAEPYPDRHFPELAIRIDGIAVRPEDRFEAFRGKTDITGPIRDAGMDPWAIAHNPPITPVNPDSRILRVLERMHAVQRSGDEYLAQWTARRILRIPLGTAAQQRIALAYLARPALSQVSSGELVTEARERAYCLSPKQVNSLLHVGPRPRMLQVNEYLIATGIDGRPPATVTLTIATDPRRAAGSRAFDFACAPHGKPLAVAGKLNPHPVEVDQSGNLRILEITEP